MSAVSKDYAALAASTSTLLESSMMEGDELYDPTTVPIANEEWSKKGGTTNLCRICANTSDYFIPIFEGEGLEHQLSEKIDKHLPIKVCDSDSLPIHVCYQCASTLIAWHDLLLNCVEAEKKLLQIQRQVEQDDLESKVIEFDGPSMDSDTAEDSVEPTTPLVTPEEMEKSAPSTSKKNTSIKERPSLKRSLAKKSSSGQKKARKTEPEKSPVVPEDGSAEETVVGRWGKLSTTYLATQEVCDNTSLAVSSAGVISIVECRKQTPPKTTCALKIKQPYFDCEYCGKRLLWRENMKTHLRIHSGERPYTCHVCGGQFRESTVLNRHIREVHERVRDHACDICGKKFANKRTLNDHIRIHTGERPYICDCCGKTFKTKAALYIHKKCHGDSFPFSCKYCGKLFRLRCNMVVHLTTHTGDKPFMCDMCGQTFGVKHNLTHHRHIHAQDKPFGCTQCGAMFQMRRYLKRHEKTHKGKR